MYLGHVCRGHVLITSFHTSSLWFYAQSRSPSLFISLTLPSLSAQLGVNTTTGKICCGKRGVVLSRAEDLVSTRDGERSLYRYLSSVQGLGGFQDHYDWCALTHLKPRLTWVYWPLPFHRILFAKSFPAFCCSSRWVSNTYSIRGGKPMWVDPFDQSVQHIFIDDNVRQNDEDTIVHPKVLSHAVFIFLIFLPVWR